MASTTIPISSIPQWQLLLAVSPVFSSSALKWEPLFPGPSENVVTNDSMKLFRIHLSQIQIYIKAEDELSPTHHEIFTVLADTLLSTMHDTVDPGIPQVRDDDDGLDQDPLYSNALLRKKWPRLLGLAYLQNSSKEWTDHLVLQQDPSVFKSLKVSIELFIDVAKQILPGGAAQTTKPPSKPSSSRHAQKNDDTAQARELFSGYSKRLFAGIVQRLAGCPSPHRALLHLKGPSDAHDGKPAPRLTMFVAFCPERNTWQQVVCSEHVAGTESASDDSSRDVDDICELARSCSEGGCILGVELKGETLLDTTCQSMDEEPSLLDGSSITDFTLYELLRRGIFQESYNVFPNDKKILAYILARALLWLYGGPWLQTPWSADKLVFRYDAVTHTIYNVHQPYILCDMQQGLPQLGTGDLNQFPQVLAFAKILVDLDQGCIDETSDASDRAPFKTVRNYLKKNKDITLSPGYFKALYSSTFFNKHLKELQRKNPNATIQDAILEGIVNPLEMDVHMDMKDQWGCRNVTYKNNTSVMARPAISKKSPGRKPPTTQHPTPALPRTTQMGSNTTASRLSVHPTPTNPRPANRPVTTRRSVTPSRTTGTMTAARHNAVPTRSMETPRAFAPRQIQSSGSNTPKTTNSGHNTRQEVPKMHSDMRPVSINGPESPSLEPSSERGSLCRVPIPDSHISTYTFRYMNFVTDEYLQHTEDDTPIRVAVIDTGIAAEAAPAAAEPTPVAGLPSEHPSPSYWLQDPSSVLLGHRSTPELPAEADVVVIGSGITGSFAADKLVGSGDGGGSVLLLEAREACSGATGRNGGHCQPMIYYSAPDVAAFELATFDFLQRFVAKNNIACDWRTLPQGGVHAYLDQDLFDAAVAVVNALAKKQPGLAKQVAVVRAGAPAVKAGPHDTPVTLKDLRLRDGVAGALVQKHAASVWPYKLVAWVLERLVTTQPSTKFNLQTNTPATKLTKDGPGWRVDTPRGTVKAKAVLLATNGYTSHLLPPSLADLIVPVRAQVSALVPPTAATGRATGNLAKEDMLASSYIFMGHDHELPGGRGERDEYLVQRPLADAAAASSKAGSGGHLIFGGGRERAANSGVGVWRDDEVEPAVADFLRTHLAPTLDVGDQGVPPAPLKADYEWTGVMGFSRDHHPWVGRVPSEILGEPADETSSLYIAAGFSGHGMPSTSLCGRAVAKLIRKDLQWTSAVADEAEETEEADHALPDCLWLTTERLAKVRATCAPVAEADKRGFMVDFRDLLEARLADQ